jgi:photosystem II stability/assembly factor-like uncharacterized protein
MTPLLRFAATLVVVATLTSVAAAADAFAVFKSSDRGRSWTRSDHGIPERSRIHAFGSAGHLLFVGTDSGIFTSDDKALSWQPGTGAATASGRVSSFASLGGNVFGGTDGAGMLVSADGGRSWALDAAFPGRKVRCLLVHDDKVYAGTDAEGVLASHDAGRTWTRLAAGLPVHGQVFALSAVEGRLFAGLYSRGLYSWDRQGPSWAKVPPVTPLALASVEGTLIAGHNPGGLSWSADLGVSWFKGVAGANAAGPLTDMASGDLGELSAEAPVWALASSDGVVFAGASAGIYYSEDRGRTWTRARTGLPEESAGIAFLLERGFVLAGAWVK